MTACGMNAERLLALYERVADAPDAVSQLRRFVLDLAVRGKLVEQAPGDEVAALALGRIAEERQRLADSGEIRSAKNCQYELLDEHPYELPVGWSWRRLGALVLDSDSGWSPKTETHARNGNTWGVLKVSAVSWGVFDPAANKQVLPGTQPRLQAQVHEGDFLISRANTAELVARAVLVDEQPTNLMMSDKIVRLRLGAACDHRFVVLANNAAEHARAYYAMNATGVSPSMKNVSRWVILNLPFPVPPLSEQHRIVAKVDELMALCDRLETARAQREAARDKLAAASLARLNTPDPDPATFAHHARFALDTLPTLTTRPDQIKQLRQTILNLAVRGKLVAQEPSDTPDSDFDPTLPARIEKPFSIPRGWQWARLRTLGSLKGGGTPSKSRSDFWGGTIPWVSPKDMKSDYLSGAQLSITESALSGSSVNLVAPESLLFVVRGMILAHSFPVAVSRTPLTINQDMKALVLAEPACSEYLLRALKGLKPEMLALVQRSSHGTCRIEGADYSNFPIPIPPLAEQYRIVAKVDELMALCDRLEASLNTADASRRRLLDALLYEALNPVSTERAAEAENA